MSKGIDVYVFSNYANPLEKYLIKCHLSSVQNFDFEFKCENLLELKNCRFYISKILILSSNVKIF